MLCSFNRYGKNCGVCHCDLYYNYCDRFGRNNTRSRTYLVSRFAIIHLGFTDIGTDWYATDNTRADTGTQTTNIFRCHTRTDHGGTTSTLCDRAYTHDNTHVGTHHGLHGGIQICTQCRYVFIFRRSQYQKKLRSRRSTLGPTWDTNGDRLPESGCA